MIAECSAGYTRWSITAERTQALFNVADKLRNQSKLNYKDVLTGLKFGAAQHRLLDKQWVIDAIAVLEEVSRGQTDALELDINE